MPNATAPPPRKIARRASVARLTAEEARDLVGEIHMALWPNLADPDAAIPGAAVVERLSLLFAHAGLHPGAVDKPGGRRLLFAGEKRGRR